MDTIEDRFMSKVIWNGGEDECWTWEGARSSGRYGSFRVGGRGGRVAKTHRLSWELFIGPIPDGLHVLHTCDNPPCVNPAHLWLGTHADNMADMKAKGRGNWGSHRLTAGEVDEIRLLRAEGTTQKGLAVRFGIDPSCISRIVNRKTWAHR